MQWEFPVPSPPPRSAPIVARPVKSPDETRFMRLSLINRSRTLAMALTAVLVGGILASMALAAPSTPASAADAGGVISVTAKGDAAVLDGDAATVTLTSKNLTAAGTGTSLYNIGYSYVLPAGVAYVGGSSSADAGEPTSTTNAQGQTVLVWSDVSDLLAGDEKSFSFDVKSVDGSFPVGSSFQGTATAAGNTNARLVPTFDPSTGAPASNATNADTEQSNATAVSALKITKAEPSPETELMRGVHAHPTVYTLTVSNTSNAPTDNVTVTDDLPAGLEFLGCGGIDNTTSGAEYTGAPSLTATTGAGLGSDWVASDCTGTAIQSVDTVNGITGHTGVFTQVLWNVGTLGAGQTITIKYLAAIPLRENTMDFSGQPGQAATQAEPTAASGKQAADLDNNNGPLTRQNTSDTTSNAQSETNYATAAGSYTGMDSAGATGSAQTASTSYTVKAMDLSVVKSVNPTTFTTNALATYSLRIRSSEYDADQAMTITDTIPDGICPAYPASITPTGDTIPSECNPSTHANLNQDATNATITAVSYSATTGEFTLTMSYANVGTNSDQTVTYKALMRPDYSSATMTGPTAAGDSFTNDVSIKGTSVAQHGETGNQAVVDNSSATITAPMTQISKAVLPASDSQGVTSVADCQTGGRTGEYVASSTDAFALGDLACFQLTVTFPAGVQSRNASVTDLLPVGTTALDAAWGSTQWAVGSASDVPASQVTVKSGTAAASSATFTVGAASGSNGMYVDGSAAAQKLVMYVVAKISTQGSSTTAPDKVDNLMKFSQQNSMGTLESLRADAGYQVAAPPTATLAKAITGSGTSASTITSTVPSTTTEGQVLQYTLTVGNQPSTGNADAMSGVTVWDALPSNVTCAAVSNISNGGTCSPTPPTSASSTYSADAFLVWPGFALASAATSTLQYDVTTPANTPVSTSFTNHASVVSFATTNDTGATTTYVPTPNPGTSLQSAAATAAQGSAPTADAAAAISTPVPTGGKTGSAVQNGQTTLPTTSAVPGEGMTYTYHVTIPANSSVKNGALADTLPAGVTTTASSSWAVSAQQGSATPVTATATTADQTFSFNGATFTLTGSNTTNGKGAGAVVFPTGVYDNANATAESFTVTVTGLRVSPTTAATSVTNTAAFTSDTWNSGTSGWQVTTPVVHPSVTLTKTNNTTGPVIAGQQVVWTLTATNTSGADLNDAVIVDCFPNSLTYVSSSTGGAQATSAQATAAGCDSTTTAYAWTVGTIGAAGSGSNTAAVTITGQLKTTSASAASYKNTAWVEGSSLADGANDSTNEAVATNTANNTISVQTAGVTKTLTAPTWNADGTAGSGVTTTPTSTATTPLRPGDAATYTVTVTIPAQVNLYDAAISDPVPAGYTVGAASGITVTTSANPGFTPGTPTVSGNTVSIGLGDVASSAQNRTVTVSIPVTVTSTDTTGTALNNQALLLWNDSHQGTSPTAGKTAFQYNATSNTSKAIVDTPKPTVAKTVGLGTAPTSYASSQTPVPGQTFTYRLQLSDAGTNTSPSYDTVVQDCVPVGVTVLTVGNGGQTGTKTGCGTLITWPAQTVPVGTATATYTYTARFADDSTLTGSGLVNTASVVSFRSLPDAGDGTQQGTGYTGSSTSTATVTPSFPKVLVTKADKDAHVAFVGVASTFTVTFANSGSAASSVTATDVLPHNWTYVANSATLTTSSGTSTLGEPTQSGAAATGTTLVWAGLPTLANGATYTVTYKATPTADATTDSGSGTTNHTNSVTAQAFDATGGTSSANTGFVTYAGGGSAATDSERIQAADLAITKTAVNAPVAGTTTTDVWTIAVANKGADAANGTTVVDAPSGLPSGATLAFTGTDWTCSTTAPYSCVNTETVLSGSSYPVLHVAMTLPAGASLATIDNTATIEQATGQTFDPNTGNDQSEASTTPVAHADLSIVKTLNGATSTVHAGDAVSWNLAVANAGPSTARGTITVSDTLPNTVTATTAEGDGWTCTVAGNDVSCTTDGLGVVAANTITVHATVKSSVTSASTIENTATVGYDHTAMTDTNASNNSSSVSSPVDDTTTLSIAKELDGTITAGDDANWKLTVRNTGDADARAVTVHDTLQSGTTLDGSPQTDGDWTCSSATGDATDVTCTLPGTLAAGASSTFDLTVTTPSNLTGAVLNTASVTSDNAQEADVTASSDPSAQTSALRIAKSVVGATAVDAGQQVTYQLQVTNPTGPSDLPASTGDAVSMTVRDPLPTGFTFVSASGDGWTVTSGTDSTVVLTSQAGLAVGAQATPITIVAAVPADYRPAVAAGETSASVPNVATVTPDSAAGTQSSSNEADVDVSTEADLSVTKTLTSAASADAGTDVSYDVTVHNDGPSDAQSAQWVDTPPTGMTIDTIGTDDPTWTASSTGTTWTTPTFAAGTTTVFHVTATIASGVQPTTLTNTAALSWTDLDQAHDHSATATADVQVTAHAHLALTKTPVAAVGDTTAGPTTVTAGGDQVWLLSVTNEGPSDERPTTTVQDTLPTGMTFVRADSTGSAWNCAADTVDPSIVSCSLPTPIAAGATAPAIWLTTRIASAEPAGTMTNDASITAQGTPDTGIQGVVTSSVTVQDVANVAIAIHHTGTAVIGQDMPETITVTNPGSSDAAAVQVVYTLPKGLTYTSADVPDGWTADAPVHHADGTTTIAFHLTSPLAGGASAPQIVVHQTPTADAYPGVTPSATVSTSTTETTLQDNDASDALTVAPLSELSVTKTHVMALERGHTVAYTITVHNAGPTADPGPVTVTDALPTGLTFVSADGEDAATCTSGQTVTCTLDAPLAVDHSVAVVVTVQVAANAPDSIDNHAVVVTPTAQLTPIDPTSNSDPLRTSDPAAVRADPTPSSLAFTGSAGMFWAVLAAALAIGGGLAATVLGRGRRRRLG
jgi:large repetitive protein